MNKIKDYIKNLPDRAKAVTASGTIIALVLGIFLIGTSLSSPSTTILQNKEIEGLKIKNINLEYNEGVSTYTAEITNTNENSYNLKYIEIVFEDSEGKKDTLIGYIGNILEGKETKEIKSSIDKDITNAVSIEYNIIK